MARTARPTTAGSRGPAFRQAGFTFMALLIIFAATGGALAAAGTFWHQAQQREKEKQLLFVGQQFRRAIRQYYEGATGDHQYPPSLEVLLQDPRLVMIRRYLRKPWVDPLTGHSEWGLVLAPQGGIMGVYSLAEGTPIKQGNFPPDLGWAEGLGSYTDWKFIYQPPQAGATPGSAPVAPTTSR